ncbi:MAG: hypothetical protein IPK21_07170 [Haliscomenobacter sp.]|nr:hypothetical protein [Haliscomenobacter sp.]
MYFAMIEFSLAAFFPAQDTDQVGVPNCQNVYNVIAFYHKDNPTAASTGLVNLRTCSISCMRTVFGPKWFFYH